MKKKCIDCGRQYKPNGGNQKRCINCGKAYEKAYRQTLEYKAREKARKQTLEYKAREKARKKAYRQTPERKAFKKAYRQTPEYKAYMKAYDKAYRQTPERKAYMKAYNQKPEQKVYNLLREKKRCARKKGLPNTFAIVHWRNAIKYFRHACAYCGEFSQDFHQEHFIPVVSGGGYTPDNIVPACPKCNLQKWKKPALEFLYEIGHADRYEMIVSYLKNNA